VIAEQQPILYIRVFPVIKQRDVMITLQKRPPMKSNHFLFTIIAGIILTGSVNSCKKSTADKCSATVCYNAGVTSDSGSACHCKCAAGYFGDSCQNTNKCSSTICYNGGIPTDTGATCYCKCGSGYFGDSCQTTIVGKWQVYKYLLNNVDQTARFMQQYTNYNISFTAPGAFSETYLPNGNTPEVINNGNYHFLNNNTVIELDDSLQVPTGRQYTMFDLSSTNMQFVNDTSRLFMSKLP
jgi:hypothetical protein